MRLAGGGGHAEARVIAERGPDIRPGPPYAENRRMRTMALERTLSIIKPDATRRNLTGKINARFEEAGFRIIAQKRLRLSRAEAEAFYAVPKGRPFLHS